MWKKILLILAVLPLLMACSKEDEPGVKNVVPEGSALAQMAGKSWSAYRNLDMQLQDGSSIIGFREIGSKVNFAALQIGDKGIKVFTYSKTSLPYPLVWTAFDFDYDAATGYVYRAGESVPVMRIESVDGDEAIIEIYSWFAEEGIKSARVKMRADFDDAYLDVMPTPEELEQWEKELEEWLKNHPGEWLI